MKKYLVVLGATLAVVVTSCSAGSSGVTLEQKTTVTAPSTGNELLSCDQVESAERTASGPAGCVPESDRLVPAVGYQCADGTMVYSTDTSHGRDGEKWAVVYDAAKTLEAQC
ncbi:hypothetical protein BH10ACT3_BH10ACT3_02660 [soil metagenome]